MWAVALHLSGEVQYHQSDCPPHLPWLQVWSYHFIPARAHAGALMQYDPNFPLLLLLDLSALLCCICDFVFGSQVSRGVGPGLPGTITSAISGLVRDG